MKPSIRSMRMAALRVPGAEKNTGGGAFPVGFYNTELQALADNLNELKEDSFDGDEEDDYYEDDKKNYDKDASYIISGRCRERSIVFKWPGQRATAAEKYRMRAH